MQGSGEPSPTLVSRKRSRIANDKWDAVNEPESKRLFSIFSRPLSRSEGDRDLSQFRWLEPLSFPGSSKTCLHGVNLTPPLWSKVAAFDLDGTLIKSQFTKRKMSADSQWEWWCKTVPSTLKQLHDDGFAVVILSNQCIGAGRLLGWQKKVSFIAASLPEVPFRIFAATAKDIFRKPMPGMWLALERLLGDEGIELDVDSSFYVGDAAGRAGDHAGTDRKFAVNLALRFQTPEEYFLHALGSSFKLKGSRVTSVPDDVPLISPSCSPLLPFPSHPEVIVFVGYPAMGKTTFFNNHFRTAGYVHIDQDTLGSRAKCVRLAEESIKKGLGCVVDSTNRDRLTRKYYASLTKQLGVPLRCFLFQASMELAWHNNLYRSFCQPVLTSSSDELQLGRKLIPYSAFVAYKAAYEEPSLSEGFQEIKHVNWKFVGCEKSRRMWSMWLQIDGK